MRGGAEGRLHMCLTKWGFTYAWPKMTLVSGLVICDDYMTSVTFTWKLKSVILNTTTVTVLSVLWFSVFQDNNGPGTAIQTLADMPAGWVEVRWDNGYVNTYRAGYEGKHDVVLAPVTGRWFHHRVDVSSVLKLFVNILYSSGNIQMDDSLGFSFWP